MRVVAAGLTDVGMKRTGNEDSFALCEDLGLYLVADGMGGHAAGEVASGTAVQVITDYVRGTLEEMPPRESEQRCEPETWHKILVTGVQLANETICGLASENATYEGMGTTLSGAILNGSRVFVVHVGDSRVYLLRAGELRQLTTDHSWVNEQLQRNIITPEEARTHRWRNVITRALGHKVDLEVDSIVEDVVQGDCLLLCSDGLTGMVDEETIRKTLLDMSDNPKAACRRLVDLANDAGGFDNVTLIVVKVTG
jgi:PPM family protein phosphatase